MTARKRGPAIRQLIQQLTDRDGFQRQQARLALVKLGKPVVPALIEALSDKNARLRWEACKALGGIKDPAASAAFVDVLDDDRMEIRWLAAEGLIAIGRQCLVPLLEALEHKPESIHLREGAHHVLHALEKEHLLKGPSLDVLDTIRSVEADITVPLAARRALDSLK